MYVNIIFSVFLSLKDHFKQYKIINFTARITLFWFIKVCMYAWSKKNGMPELNNYFSRKAFFDFE